MVTFEETMGGLAVKIDGQPFGHISKERGFFTDPTVVRQFLEASSDDLRKIALKAEVQQGFVTCTGCGHRAMPYDSKPTYLEFECPNCERHISVFR